MCARDRCVIRPSMNITTTTYKRFFFVEHVTIYSKRTTFANFFCAPCSRGRGTCGDFYRALLISAFFYNFNKLSRNAADVAPHPVKECLLKEDMLETNMLQLLLMNTYFLLVAFLLNNANRFHKND